VLALAACAAAGPSAPAPRPLALGARFQGGWHSNWGVMQLQRRDNRVFGTYPARNGSIWGGVEGNVFRFNWRDGSGRWGRGWMVLSDDGTAMQGRWGYEKEDSTGGVWRASRTREQKEYEID
jgi:hypothetical protein